MLSFAPANMDQVAEALDEISPNRLVESKPSPISLLLANGPLASASY